MNALLTHSTAALLLSFAAASADAKWESGKPSSEPNRRHVISSDNPGLAKGYCKARLVEGGPTGLYVWAKLKGEHRGADGKTTYLARIAVQDESGYYYWISPQRKMSIGGVLLKSSVKKYAHGQFRLNGEVLKAHKEGKKLRVVSLVSRNRSGPFDSTLRQIEKLSVSDALKLLNRLR